jgi:BASS family bile acid:Na+ symporter
MSLAELVLPALQASVAVLVFTIGLGTTPAELMHLARRPGKLVRSLVSMNLVMLAVAVGIVMVLPLAGPMKIMLVALALSPIPPILPKKLVKAGGGHDYVMALLCTASVFAIIWIPLAGEALDRIFPADITIPPTPVAMLVSMTVLGPTLAGVVMRLIAPRLAQRIAGPLGTVATLLLLCGLGLILVKAGPAMLALIGNGTLLAIVAFVLLGLVAGHLLGGPDPGDRSVLALATASRHPGVALAIAHITFPAEQAVTAAALLYLVTSIVVTVPYVAWRRKALDADRPPAIAEVAAPR